MPSTQLAIVATNFLSSVPIGSFLFIGPILTIIVMLSFFTRAALKETPYWSKNAEKAFYVFAIPISAVFLFVIGVRIALAFSGG